MTDDEALFDPGSHEPLTTTPWDPDRARTAIRTIVADAERAFAADALWPPHPLDEEEDEPPLDRVTCLYLGAAGVVWALHALERAGAVELRRSWADAAAGLSERYRRRPDFPEDGWMPSLMLGEAGVLLVAHALAPSSSQEERLLEVVRANEANPTRELLWGAPGTMLAAQVMHERTGAAAWAEAWRDSADGLWAAWDEELWCQDIAGRRAHHLGAAHGFAGNVLALARGDLLDAERRQELERRAVDVLAAHARRSNGLAQWPPAVEPPGRPQPIRTQWCHGAPGIVTSLATLAPDDDRLTDLLLAGGELTWSAGPLLKGAGLCHGTAGNGYALLKLFERTGDERWLGRGRSFAMHAIEQVEAARARFGRGRYTLWTGDVGTALYLASCLAVTTGLPTLDVF